MSEQEVEKVEGEELKGGAKQNDSAVQPALSKRAQKRMERIEEKKALKRQEKAKRQVEKQIEREHALKKYFALPEEERKRMAEVKKAKIEKAKLEKNTLKEKLQAAVKDGPRLVVDMGFANLMTNKEVNSLCQQLGKCYANIRKAEKPFHLYFTDLNGPVQEKYEQQWGKSGGQDWVVTKDSRSYLEVFQSERDSIVYLTPDSGNMLEELDEKAIYVIGGFVDRNRHKAKTFKEAKEIGIKTAAFPITQHFSLKASTVLTVDQCVAVMSHCRDSGCWVRALNEVIPQRKRKQADADRTEESTREDSKKKKES